MKLMSKTIDELKPVEIVKIFQERVAVFVVEQNCVYQDVDNIDYDARHLCLWSEGKELQAYCRLIDHQTYVMIGRVLSAKKYRGSQFGRQLITTALAEINELYPGRPIKIAAQAYLLNFYKSFGFETNSTVYLEDGIEHVDMILTQIKTK